MRSITHQYLLSQLGVSLFIACFTTPLHAIYLNFNNTGFSTTPVFSNVQTFSFEIEVGEALKSGAYFNPNITGVNYAVSGALVSGTPSNFPAFALQRPEPGNQPIPGIEFYSQGSSLQFEIAAGANLSDGLQVSDLAELSDFTLPSSLGPDPLLSSITSSNNPVFVFNGREIENETGFSRFHPTLLVLNSDGTGSLRNSNNIVNKNGFTEILFGSEYITNVTFDPATTTLSSDVAQVPIPSSILLFVTGLLYLYFARPQLRIPSGRF